ncbi:OCIA domain-containing protein 2 [Antennarius striatus]|uniref:OCIA domain-containing protein 2 n=1 Tax=Antennarius striatus TaxID=241820 RepID=UPI0035B4AB38
MTSGEAGQTITVTTEAAEPAAAGPAALKGTWMCPIGDHHIHQNDFRMVWKECQEESFWYRALPFSAAGMTFTGILIYNGIWKSSKRFGPFPKLIGAGIFGFALGKASYAGTCRKKFQQLGFGPDRYGKDRDHRLRCHHVCDECKKKAESAPEKAV